MKRILSIFLCIAMLSSMIAMTAVAYDEDVYNGITNENIMSFKVTDGNSGEEKTTFKPGDTIFITGTMDSIWGDPEIDDDVTGYEGNVLPGAYGMSTFTTAMVFPIDVFTPKAGASAAGKSTIANFSGICPVTKTALADAKKTGFYSFITEALTMNEDEDQYTFFTGSGELCTWKLTVNEDAAAGTYLLPVGAYAITDYETGAADGLIPKWEFFGNWYADLGHSDSQLNDRAVKFVSPTGQNVNDDPTQGAYIAITIEGEGGSVTPPEPPVVEDPMSFEFAAADGSYVAGDTVEVVLSVKNNEGLDQDAISSHFEFDNSALKLIGISTPIAGLEAPELSFDSLNAQGKYEDLGKLTSIDAFFTGSASVTEDCALITLTFEVLPTAAGAETKVIGASNEAHEYPDAVIKLAANHTHDFKENVTPATCTTKGYTDTACACGLTYRTAEESAKGHTASTDPADTISVPATCTERGYTTTKCSVCGGAAKVTYSDALGHDFEQIVSEVSCTTDGFTMNKCKTCGHEEDKVITATAYGHKNPDGSDAYGEPYISTKPTTSSVGYWGKDCSICGDTWEFEEIKKLDIMWGDNDMNGKINLGDVAVLLKHIAKWKNLYISLDNADVTHDGRINALDASKLLKYIAKWPNIDLSAGATVVG